MGFILKFILIAVALSWIFSKLLKFFVRTKIRQFATHADELRREEERRKRPEQGGVKVDHIPPTYQEKRNRDLKGGDYIDYEEVKD
ncbi:DUF4834 domain-containing protein [Mongoliitalea daihaiensis]|uniref:DUF4834 domain-containing protein n=1 Tax=Mongoliitalea daihaiensis TaxID=2782006 RepID=UPI001F278263|nr:DUF4834 domain-containing protein [Mongoliitalea daihaiensis]UJP65559.1 DUF4834 domain-containing protein [Mongoliitalea daihaiensis]